MSVCVFVYVWVGLLRRQLENACIGAHQTGFVSKGCDHLELVKFWPSHAPGKGFCSGVKICGSALLQSERSVCVSSKRFLLTIEQTLGKAYPVLWGMIQPSSNLSGMMYNVTLSDASMLYFADVFLYIFYARLSWPNG